MNDILMLSLQFWAGVLLGAFFYGGLWWTVRRVAANASALWLLGSFLVRAILVLAGLYAVTRGEWPGIAACFGGFLVARPVVTRLIRPKPGRQCSEQALP
jgi:F1F0 ATPase subunit 2